MFESQIKQRRGRDSKWTWVLTSMYSSAKLCSVNDYITLNFTYSVHKKHTLNIKPKKIMKHIHIKYYEPLCSVADGTKIFVADGTFVHLFFVAYLGHKYQQFGHLVR